MEWLHLVQVLEIHDIAIAHSGGSAGLRDPGALESALAQPMQTFGGIDLYSGLIQKAAALGFFLVRNHPFVDGNKRVGHAALEIVLQLNGYEILIDREEQETVVLALAAGELSLDVFTQWVAKAVVPLDLSTTKN